MRAVPDTSPAVYAEFINYMSLSIMHTDCLSRAVFDAVDAASADFCLKPDRTHKFIHKITSA